MLIEIKKLNIANDGYTRKVTIDKMYVNADHIISITDYDAINSFLLSENSQNYKDKQFSLIKVSEGKGVFDIIALGSAKEIYLGLHTAEKRLLNG